MDPQNTNPPMQPESPQEPVQSTPDPVQSPEPTPTSTVGPTPGAPIGGEVAPSSPKSGPNKGLLIGLVAGGIAVVVIIIVVVIISMLSVSKKDYQDALSEYNNVADTNYTLNSKVSSLQYGLSDGTQTSFSNDVDAAKKAITDLNSENDKLGKFKAVSVGDGKKKYDTFNDKLTTYTKYANNLLTSLVDARSASEKCDSTSTSSATNMGEVKIALDACVAALEKVSDTPDGDIKQFISKLKDEYQSLSSIVAKIAAITDPYGDQYDQYSSLRDQMYDIQDNISDASTDFQSNLEKHADAVDPKDAANDLAKFLEDEASK